MKYWNTTEITDYVLTCMEIDTSSNSKELQGLIDTIIDFVADLVHLHNFQIERENDNTNVDVGMLIGNYSANLAVWFIVNTAAMLAAHGISDEAKEMFDSWGVYGKAQD